MAAARPKLQPSQAKEKLWKNVEIALQNDDAQRLEALLNYSEDLEFPDDGAYALALWLSCEYGHRAYAELLLRRFHADPNFSFPDGRETALMSALVGGRTEIAELLLDWKASPNTIDKQGRTALVTAAWQDQVAIVKKLIEKKANVKALDDRGRNALHHYCEDENRQANKWDTNEEILKALLHTTIDVDQEETFANRTPLHFAAKYNVEHAARSLIDHKATVDAKAFDDETPLHIAAEKGHVAIAKLLIEKGASVTAKKGTGWTPLHCAAEHKEGYVEIVKALVAHAPNDDYVNMSTKAQITPLHTASQAGNVEIVEFLLAQTGIDVGMRDTSGNTAMLYAAQHGHKDIVRKLVERNYAALSEDALEASKECLATITDFTPGPRDTNICDRQFKPIFSLLYGGFQLLPEKETSEKHQLRWIHLPANSVVWCQELLIQTLRKETSNPESFEALLQSFNHEHVGSKVHAHYMRPDCHLIPVATPTIRTEGSHSPTPSSERRDRNRSMRNHDQGSSKPANVAGPTVHKQNVADRTLSAPAKLPQLRTDQLDDRGRLSSPRDPQTGQGTDDSTDLAEHLDNSMYLFMPYLHYEWTDQLKDMHKAVSKARQAKAPEASGSASRTAVKRNLTPSDGLQVDSASADVGKSDGPSADLKLVQSHVNVSNCSVHIRRTLDQFFYRTIDTSFRDGDQVVLRHQRKMCKQCKEPAHAVTPAPTQDPIKSSKQAEHCKKQREDVSLQCTHKLRLIMVDQLWMWVVSPELIITSFPQRWKQKDHDRDRLHERILRHVRSPTHATISDAHELALVIASQCTEALDMQTTRTEGALFLDMFESTLGHVMDSETQLFRKFEAASHEASRWLRNRSTLPGKQELYHAGTSAEDVTMPNTETMMEGDGAEPVFIHTMLDIRDETLLLREIKDIRDELGMLVMILKQQETICQEAYNSVTSALAAIHSHQSAKLEKAWENHRRRFNTPLGDIIRMQEQAKGIYDSIKDLLDMKQKYANALQASDTARSGQTLMVFTIVTVVFLPLSFIAAFFAINIKSFPHDAASGNTDMSLSYVSQYVFGVGFAIALPCVIVALTVKNIVLFTRKWYRRAQLKMSRRQQRGPRHLYELWKESKSTTVAGGTEEKTNTVYNPSMPHLKHTTTPPSGRWRRGFGHRRRNDEEQQRSEADSNGVSTDENK